MKIKILNSILFKVLMPWTFDNKCKKAINEIIKKIEKSFTLSKIFEPCHLLTTCMYAIVIDEKKTVAANKIKIGW